MHTNDSIFLSNRLQIPLFPDDTAPEIPEIQESTMQIPCGDHSIFDLSCHSLPEYARLIYTIMNMLSNWDTGISHAISYSRLAKLSGNKPKSQAIRAVKQLIEAGFIKVLRQKRSTGENIYQIIHHNCSSSEVPLDKDNRPLKCAVAAGKGSPLFLLAEGKITWREAIFLIVRKIFSNWKNGISELTVKEMKGLLRFSMKSICSIPKRLIELGLLERLSANFRKTIFKIFPGPYPKRRKRAEYNGKRPLPLIKGWYYSFNMRWKFHKETLRLLMKEDDGKWRDAAMTELYRVNPAIHRDFNEYIDYMSSSEYQKFQEGVRKFLATS